MVFFRACFYIVYALTIVYFFSAMGLTFFFIKTILINLHKDHSTVYSDMKQSQGRDKYIDKFPSEKMF